MSDFNNNNFIKKSGTVFICDIRNSTKLYKKEEKAKKMLPKMFKEIYEESIKIIFSIIENEDNIHYNDTGDGFICGFTGENHIIKAFYCASKIREKLFKIRKRYNTLLGTNIRKGLDYGIGIYSDELTVVKYFVKKPKCEKILKKTFVGNACNIAARIESFTNFQKYKTNTVEFIKYNNCRLLTSKSTIKKLLDNLNKLRNTYKNLPEITYKNLVLKKLGSHSLKGLEDTPFFLRAVETKIHDALEKYLKIQK